MMSKGRSKGHRLCSNTVSVFSAFGDRLGSPQRICLQRFDTQGWLIDSLYHHLATKKIKKSVKITEFGLK